MTHQREEQKNELERIKRVADQLASMHSLLRDEYGRKSIVVDCVLFGSSIILVAFVFIDPLFLDWSPFTPIVSRILIGTFAILTFFFTLVINRVDWRSKSELHKHSAEIYADMKLECQEILTNFENASDIDIQKLSTRYRYLGRICVAIPDSSFLRLKNKHQTKVAISKYLDNNPGTFLWLLKIKIWYANIFKTPSDNPLSEFLGNMASDKEDL